MVKWGTQEFADAYAESINNNKAYEEAAADWEGDFLWVATPRGELSTEMRMWIGLYHGKCTGARVLNEDEEVRLLKTGEKPTGKGVEVHYIFTADYLIWKKLASGELDSIKALMTRKAKLKGDMGKIMRYTKAAAELSATSQKIDIEWL
ncbi:MAG: SCP2 sterol-binding domain-containing protein [Promethearchaeota archaeon]